MVFGGETAESYYDEGLTASMKGELTTAIRCFERTIQLDSGFAAAYHQLGRCYLRQGDAAKAVRILEPLVRSKPNQIPARLDLGLAYMKQGFLDRAREQFEAVLEKQKTNGRAHLGLANVCFLEGQWHAAAQLAQQARSYSGASFAALFLLGKAAKLAGEIQLFQQAVEQADALLEQSIELNPEQPEGYYLRGELAFVKGDMPAALDAYRSAEDRAEPEKNYAAFGEYFNYLDILAKEGLCLQKLGQPHRAREIGQKIVAADPGHKLGQALAELE